MEWRTPVSSTPASPAQNASSSGVAKISPLVLNPDSVQDPLSQPQPQLQTQALPQSQPLTLVIPTLHIPKSASLRRAEQMLISPRTGKPYSNRLRGHKTSHSMSMDLIPPQPIEDNWVAPLGKFDIEQEAIELAGFQMYAVEKW